MSEHHHLPDDLTSWPTDAFALLGIAPGVSARDLKLAYTRLIRRYKPEQFPEHFRRIRDAYETAQRFAPFFGSSEVTFDGVTWRMLIEPECGPDTAAPASPQEESAESPTPPRRHSPEEKLTQLWEQACAGKEAAAYAELVELSRQQPSEEQVYLQLYWLLSVFPELDAGRAPCDWLAEGLGGDGSNDRLRELYGRELAERTEEATTPRCHRLLNSLPPATLVEWLGPCWRGAADQGRYQVILDDLAGLQERVCQQDEVVWARLLFLAADFLAWTEARDARWTTAFARCRREAEELTHLSGRLAYELDRLDFLEVLAEGWRQLRQLGLPSAFVSLFPASWTRPFAEVRRPLLTLLAQINRAPHDWLDHFDIVHAQAPVVLSHLDQLLSDLADELPAWEQTDADGLRGVAEEFLDREGGDTYEQLRPRVLEFCLREVVGPEMLAEAIADNAAYSWGVNDHLADALRADWPLRYVCRASQAFEAG